MMAWIIKHSRYLKPRSVFFHTPPILPFCTHSNLVGAGSNTYRRAFIAGMSASLSPVNAWTSWKFP
jgi:hypothetical protein